MGLFDFLNGINPKIKEAKSLYERGLYREASNILDFSEIQKMTISKEQFLEVMYISAKCHFELGQYEVTRVCLDQIINYPDYNHNYISKAEALKKQLP